jgi:hypothetical protein
MTVTLRLQATYNLAQDVPRECLETTYKMQQAREASTLIVPGQQGPCIH